MSNFPISFDDDATLPVVNNNLTEIGGDAINAIRDAVFNIEQYLGLGGDGSSGSIANRLGISLNPDGSIKPSALSSLGLVTLPITNSQIAPYAEIPESKLKLDHRTQDLFNYITDLASNVNTSLGWIAVSGSKLEPHLIGLLYRHTLDQLDVTNNPALLLKNRFRTFRDNSNGFTVINDMNNELLAHQFADGSPTVPATLITTNDGSTFPATHAHPASGIFLNTDRFSVVPQTATDLQQFADYVDSSSILLLGTRIQNLFSNGISRASRSSSLVQDGYGQSIVPPTLATAYLFNAGTSLSPFDNINTGDDIIEFTPPSSEVTSSSFDAKFALVKAGDIIRMNYGNIEIPFVIKEKKYIQSGGFKKYLVRVNGRNFKYTTDGYARIDKPLFNVNKYGALSLSAANNSFNNIPSLIVTNPTGAMALGVNFNPDLFDNSHYLLYLALFPNGNPDDGYTILPAIDVTGNAGATPGKYTLSSIVEATNNAFRQPGFNYRFVAFEYQGEFGIALADPYNNASFSILSGIVDSSGFYNSTSTNLAFPNNAIGLFAAPSFVPVDPLGFGPDAGNIASPPYNAQYDSAEQSQLPTKLFVPLKRNNYYVNGIERDKFALEPEQVLDIYGDGYWVASIINRVVIPVPGRVETTYRIPYDLDNSSLSVGKTMVVQSLGVGGLVNYGRFIIQSVTVSCVPNNTYTDITVYDSIHATGISPSNSLDGYDVAVYFNSDSVTFNAESATDFSNYTPFKRHFEVYADQNGKTFSHERGRINISGSTFSINEGVPLNTYLEFNKLNIVKISPKLRGYQFGSVNKITLHIDNLSSTTGVYTGYLCYYDGTYSKQGPVVTGYLGQNTRFFDETNVDYIDIVFDFTTSTFNNQNVDFQLFPTLSLDQEIMLLGTCQLNDTTKIVNYLRDERQFGNTSEKDLTTSALNYISLGEKYLHSNGVVRGFDLETTGNNPYNQQIYLKGGLALVNGKFISVNDQTVVIPVLKEGAPPSDYNINWALCVNDRGEYQTLPLLDYDAVLATPSIGNRLFVAYNPQTIPPSTYTLEASFFSNIVNNRKDLTILYVVASTVVVSPSITISLDVTDARRYVQDVDSNIYLNSFNNNSQGNIKSLESILNWLKYNYANNSTVFLHNFTGSTDKPVSFDFISSGVIIDGINKSSSSLSFNNITPNISQHITFKNLTLNFNQGLTIGALPINIKFENCTVNLTIPGTGPVNTTVFDISIASSISFINTTIIATYSDSVTGGALFYLNNVSNLLMDNCIVSCDFSFPAAPGGVPGDLIIVKNSNNIRILNSTFLGNYKQFLRNTSSDNVVIDNCTITSTYDPLNAVFDSTTDPLNYDDGLPNLTYNTSDLINTGRAFIYSYVEDEVSNLLINKCTFNYSPVSPSTDRLSFINLQLPNGDSTLENITITNCKFNNTTVSGSTDDLRAAIAVINTSTTTNVLQNRPKAINLVINNNYCSQNHLLAITSQTYSDEMTYPGLVPQNCIVSNNTCGTIGYWVSSADEVTGVGSVGRDKADGLSIDNNTCKLINNIDHEGQYFVVNKDVSGTLTNMCQYPSGTVAIKNNKCNWIHVGIAYEENSYLQILNNDLTAESTLSGLDIAYLANYGDTLAKSITDNRDDSPFYAIFVSSNLKTLAVPSFPGNGNDSCCLIQGNNTHYGYYKYSNLSVSLNQGYFGGYIWCQSSSIISNNILKGIDPDASIIIGAKCLILVSGTTNTITNNQIFRKNIDINSYIKYQNYIGTSVNTKGLIVDNILDSPYTDSTFTESVINTNDITNKISWVIERNVNQTGYATIPLTNGLIPFGMEYSAPSPRGYADFGVNSEYYITTANVAGPNLRSYVLRVHDEEGGGVSSVVRTIAWQQDISKHVPNNVRILNAKMGVKMFGTQVIAATSAISLGVTKYNAPSENYTTLSSFPLPTTNDPYANAAQASNIFGAAINATGSGDTIPFNIDLSSVYYVTGDDYALSTSVYVVIQRAVSNDLEMLISPVVVKYRW